MTKIAYVDTSFLLAIQFHEPTRSRAWKALRACDTAFASSLTLAEMFAALARERKPLSAADALLSACDIVVPDSDLRDELLEVMGAGPLRGADAWHCALAISIAGRKARRRLTFLTFDSAQSAVARKLGMLTTG